MIGAEAGLHMILGLPRTVDDVAVMERGLYAGVATRPLSIYHLNPEAAARGLLLATARCPRRRSARSWQAGRRGHAVSQAPAATAGAGRIPAWSRAGSCKRDGLPVVISRP